MPKPLAALLGLAAGAELCLFLIGKWQLGTLTALGCIFGCYLGAWVGMAVTEMLRR